MMRTRNNYPIFVLSLIDETNGTTRRIGKFQCLN